MTLTINIPSALQESLQREFGQNISQAAKETLAIAWYQEEKLSIAQMAEMLELSIYEAEGLLKSRSIPATYSMAELAQDQATLKRLLTP